MQESPVILGIDTSLGPCSVAIIRDNAVLAELQEASHGKQSRLLVPMIEEALTGTKLTYHDLTAIACTLGPGGFTGIRVGLATARAIAMGAQKPLIGLSTLEVIAWGAHLPGDTLAVIDAYRGQRYAQRFRANSSLVAQSDILLVEEKAIAALGHGAKIIQAFPNARETALMATEKWAAGERHFPTKPIYIREPDAKLPSEGLKYAGKLL